MLSSDLKEMQAETISLQQLHPGLVIESTASSPFLKSWVLAPLPGNLKHATT